MAKTHLQSGERQRKHECGNNIPELNVSEHRFGVGAIEDAEFAHVRLEEKKKLIN